MCLEALLRCLRFSFGGYFAVCLPREFGPQGIYIADGEDRGERVIPEGKPFFETGAGERGRVEGIYILGDGRAGAAVMRTGEYPLAQTRASSNIVVAVVIVAIVIVIAAAVACCSFV